MTPEELATFVARSCERSGVPVKVRDDAVMGHVLVLMGGPKAGMEQERLKRSAPTDSDRPTASTPDQHGQD